MGEDHSYLPLDADIRLYETTNDLEARLADRDFEKKPSKLTPDYVTLADVEGEMDGLKTDKDLDDTTINEIKKSLEQIAKSTCMQDRNHTKLTAARICLIENRLKTD